MNVGETGKELREWLKSGAPFLFVLGCAAAMLFIPQSWAHAIGIDALRDRHRAWLGVALVISVVGLVVFSGGSVRAVWSRWRLRKALKRALHNLSPEEKAVLTPYIRENTKTRYLDHLNGIVQELVSSGVLYAPGRVFDITVGVAFSLRPWAWEYLRRHPELLMVTETEAQQLEARTRRRY